MKRRQFLSMIPILGLAGCTNTEQRQGTTRETSTPHEESTDTVTRSPAEFVIEGVSAPAEVEITQSFNVRIDVRNRGGQRGTLRSQLIADDNITMSERFDFSIAVGPGESESIDVEVQLDYVDTYSLRVANSEIATTIDIVPADLKVGESFQEDNGLMFAVSDLVLVENFKYLSSFSGEVETHEPADGYQFGFVKVHCDNPTSESLGTPQLRNSNLIVAGEQFGNPLHPATRNFDFRGRFESDRMYQATESVPSAEVSGWVIYQVPEGVGVEEIEVVWAMGLNSEQLVTWSAV